VGKNLKLEAARQRALNRPELREDSSPRASAAGVTSFPVKAENEETRRLIEDFRAMQRLSNSLGRWCPWCRASHSGSCQRLISGGQVD
jgi:hypothetical protein